jgi:DNA polymerase-4
MIKSAKERVIAHSDANCFYASVEMLRNPRLRDFPMAVSGSSEDRHGIILAVSVKFKHITQLQFY